ncbi:hypothetical protein [Methanosphaera cuniculi]|uniref:Uncharacterized protein n=1 Tax=Methanosphaera cuniculi TaxID=1077256 RepID=A0A2A2HEA3_9EURY|nr:hypothetical protein [Methanosphaera cuniculi]PAV07658.1 hypothetical protein ASJ82_08250 [Methanosphaera cuniculi]PWL08016.1 hypothetical protein MSCUN_09470 [Methanosphaera cuniculi]
MTKKIKTIQNKKLEQKIINEINKKHSKQYTTASNFMKRAEQKHRANPYNYAIWEIRYNVDYLTGKISTLKISMKGEHLRTYNNKGYINNPKYMELTALEIKTKELKKMIYNHKEDETLTSILFDWSIENKKNYFKFTKEEYVNNNMDELKNELNKIYNLVESYIIANCGD